ncbi:MAG: Nramp family metal ion transporter [Idiomarinaceae bacterium HL-53]|nr:MAG: Nramp family metal ion transporter [Idiomarinaceae bacterium HL-53]CUS47710.1 Mn2+ and Fe2+ transporters of the NRAMP family [Idiomarinaceae bacterium HL-53]
MQTSIHPKISKIGALGPGLLMATAAIGGSHLVASTQAGALFGWQLLWVVLLVNVLKYPFFRFAVHYTATQEQNLIDAYRAKGRIVFGLFVALAIIAAVVNTAGVLLLTASLLQYFISWLMPAPPSVISLSLILLAICWLLLIWGKYPALDRTAKIFMLLLAIATVAAFLVAWLQGSARVEDFVPPSPWQLASFGFIIAMMGWMPAPIEISVINSLWLREKHRYQPTAKPFALLDFNVGYWSTTILALLFLGLGALIQYGSTTDIALAGDAFAQQLVNMYAGTIGEWSRWLVAFIAFVCMFGTTITVLDGYVRIFDACLSERSNSRMRYIALLLGQSILGWLIIIFFAGALGPMLTFAMALAFVTTPVFAALNYQLAKAANIMDKVLRVWAWCGLTYLTGFVLLYVWWLVFM